MVQPELAVDGFDRRQNALVHVVFEGLLGEPGIRIDPRHHEHREALVDRELDEGFLRHEIEDVIFVDPGRHHDQRPLVDLLRRRRVLDELDEVVLEDDLTRRDGQIASDFEGREIGLGDAEQILRLLEIVGKMRHASHQIFGVGLERGAYHFRIGERVVRRRERRQHLLQIEHSLLARPVVHPLGVLGDVRRPARGDQISLLPKIEILAVGPVRILEAVVAGLRFDHRLDIFAEKAAKGAAPQIGVALEKLALGGGELTGVGDPDPRHLAKGLGGFSDL